MAGLGFARLPFLVVDGKIAVLAEALRVVQLIMVRAGPGQLGPAPAMVARDAHVLCIVLLGFMGTVYDFPFFAFLLKRNVIAGRVGKVGVRSGLGRRELGTFNLGFWRHRLR